MSDINKKVVDVIVDKLGVTAQEVTLEANLANDLGADSLDIVELILEFEKVFDITIPEDQAEHIKTVGQVVEYVKKRVAGNA